MSNTLIILSDIQELNRELNLLNEKYLQLYQKIEDLKKQKEYLDRLYMSKLGALIFLKMEKEIQYRRLKKKLALIIMRKNKGEEIKLEEIEGILQKELATFYKDLKELRNNLKKSQEFLGLPTLTEEELKKVKEIFRSLAKILHPDLNEDLNKESIDLWLQIKEAYSNNDLITLIILEGIVKYNKPKKDSNKTSLEEKISILKSKIDELKNLIEREEGSFPLNLKHLIDDNQYINDKKHEITREIHEYERIIMEVEKGISDILKEKNYGEINNQL